MELARVVHPITHYVVEVLSRLQELPGRPVGLFPLRDRHGSQAIGLQTYP
jgi:hypothetical protein